MFGPGLGAGTVAASVAALSRIPEHNSGLASGFNTAALQIGGALGVAVVSTVTTSFTATSGSPAELTVGLQAGFTACIVFVVAGLLLAATILRSPDGAGHPSRETDLPFAR